jgi:peroxiredoxin
MPIAVGDRLPAGTFTHMTPEGPKPITTDEVFQGRKVVLFAVPGAFTPTCSNMHLPSYVRNYEAIRALGFDAVACLAVNDIHVLDQWARAKGAEGKVLMLADGNGEYARKLGTEVDLSRFGMGLRSRRYSMLVEDGVVRQVSFEAPGEFKVSGAEPTCGL